MTLREKVKQLIKTYKDKPHFNTHFIKQYLKKLKEDKLVKKEGTMEHMNAMFVPVVKDKNEIFVYLAHHKKADDWIPPGGHIEPNELPKDTVLREFKEELNFKVDKNKIHFYNIVIKHIDRPDLFCVTHYDLWHYVLLDKKYDFQYLKKEFYDAGWFNLKEIKGKTKHNPNFLKATLDLIKIL